MGETGIQATMGTVDQRATSGTTEEKGQRPTPMDRRDAPDMVEMVSSAARNRVTNPNSPTHPLAAPAFPPPDWAYFLAVAV